MTRWSHWIVTAGLFSMVFLPLQSSAEDLKSLPQSQMQMQLSFAPLVKKTASSVVNVYAERMVQQRSPFDDDPFFSQFFGGQMPNRTEKQSSLGSGVIIRNDGLVITNNHVIEGADDIRVALADGQEYQCKVVLKDDRVDLAVLQIKSKDAFPALPIGDSDAVDVGDLVLAIGDPFGVGQTVTSGIVSALARNKVGVSDFGFFIQTDAAINPGNSGGGLINMKGELIGINSAIFSKGGGSNGIGFAIPANMVKVFIAAAESGKPFERPYVGATFDPVTSDVAEAVGVNKVRGAIVTKVIENGPADVAGLKPGDVVVAVNGQPVEHPDALSYRLTTAGLGTNARLTVLQNGKEREVVLALNGLPESSPKDEVTIQGRNPFSGAIVANLSPKLADKLRLPLDSVGVVIEDIKQGSPAARLGFAPHDVIVSVNDVDVTKTKDLQDVIDEDPSLWRVEIERDGQRIRQIFR